MCDIDTIRVRNHVRQMHPGAIQSLNKSTRYIIPFVRTMRRGAKPWWNELAGHISRKAFAIFCFTAMPCPVMWVAWRISRSWCDSARFATVVKVLFLLFFVRQNIIQTRWNSFTLDNYFFTVAFLKSKFWKKNSRIPLMFLYLFPAGSCWNTFM